MIDSSTIVQTAVSSFNNSSLLNPTFFWSSFLMIPIFLIVSVKRTEINKSLEIFKIFLKNKYSSFLFILNIILLFYLVIMHGNYETIRNSITFIPFIIAFIIFLLSSSITNFLLKNNLINQVLKKYKKRSLIAFLILFLGLSVISGYPSVLGFILNPLSILIGVLWGKSEKYKNNETIHTSIILFLISITILMQPEFFRFGQMGNLTFIHKIFLLTTVLSIVMTISALKVPAKGFLYDRAFKKLKWIFRIIIGVFSFLFIVTESLPVFIAVITIMFFLISSSIFHKNYFDKKTSSDYLSISISLFGILSNLPIITIIGLLLTSDKIEKNIKEIKSLL